MNTNHTLALLVALAIGAPIGLAQAQGVSPVAARADVKAETRDFLKTHRWDEVSDTWMLKTGVEPPAGVTPRSVVTAQRDDFLRKNFWNGTSSTWMPRVPALATISSLTREQERAETVAFLRTHSWNEEESVWVANPARIVR